jgi:cytochrome c oxidase assembly protein subunit 15
MTTALFAAADAKPAAAATRYVPVRVWLACMALLVVVMVMVGGATRLTGSGLSITEWKPVTGAIPPLSEQMWQDEFAKYKATSQYELLNRGMDLPEFKSIYMWEWGHRQLGRFIGFAYLLPLFVFAATGRVRGRLLWTLLGIGALGGLQGGIGWIMVASGLKPGMIAVEPVKLMLHLTTASILLAAIVAMWAKLGRADTEAAPHVVRLSAVAVLAMAFVQIALGALVAGLHAGLIYNTWPLMDGSFVPAVSLLLPETPWWANAFETVATVQFDHRMGAYILFALALAHALIAWRLSPGMAMARRAGLVAALVTAQAGLGIMTLLLVVPIWAGVLHQAAAMIVLIAASVNVARLRASA